MKPGPFRPVVITREERVARIGMVITVSATVEHDDWVFALMDEMLYKVGYVEANRRVRARVESQLENAVRTEVQKALDTYPHLTDDEIRAKKDEAYEWAKATGFRMQLS